MAERPGDLRAAKERLTAEFERQMAPLHAFASGLSERHAIAYDGIDASIAPLGTAPPLTDSFESLQIFDRFGDSGTLAASALVTSAVKAIGKGITLCGYTGLMLPPCEDAGLAQRGTEKTYHIHDLLAYSSVCGLDTVPILGTAECAVTACCSTWALSHSGLTSHSRAASSPCPARRRA